MVRREANRASRAVALRTVTRPALLRDESFLSGDHVCDGDVNDDDDDDDVCFVCYSVLESGSARRGGADDGGDGASLGMQIGSQSGGSRSRSARDRTLFRSFLGFVGVGSNCFCARDNSTGFRSYGIWMMMMPSFPPRRSGSPLTPKGR